MNSPQAPSAVAMIRPHNFFPNPETAADNSFQNTVSQDELHSVHLLAYEQVTATAEKLEELGVRVHLFDDATKDTPDSVFPNNWFSTHADGRICVYPMYPENRRLERRADVLETLKAQYRVQEIIDYSGLELEGLFLEGTGSMVLDHIEKVAYAARSLRTNPMVLERFCRRFDFEPLLFDAQDAQGNAVYHTNVIMCLGSDYALLCDDMITSASQRNAVLRRLSASDRELISLTQEQINQFCGNALELEGSRGRFLAMSTTALGALTASQRKRLESRLAIEAFDVSTLELAGGSLRCMLAGIHLTPR